MRNIFIGMVCAITAAMSLPAGASTVTFDANLDGLQESPPNVSPGFGLLDGTLTGSSGSFVFTIDGTYSGILGGLTSAAIQNAAPGSNGSTVFPITTASFGATSGTFSGTWRFDDATFPLTDAQAINIQQGNEYVNLRSSVFPSGEIRGQILAVPEPATAMMLTIASSSLMLRRRRA
jgi:hypothetical protein